MKEYFDDKELAELDAEAKTHLEKDQAKKLIDKYYNDEIRKLGKDGDVMRFKDVKKLPESTILLYDMLGYTTNIRKSEKYHKYVVNKETYTKDVPAGYRGTVNTETGNVNIRQEYETIKLTRYYLEKETEYEELDEQIKIVKKGTKQKVKELETKFCKKARIYSDSQYRTTSYSDKQFLADDLKKQPKFAFGYHSFSICFFVLLLGFLIFAPGYFSAANDTLLDCYVWNLLGVYNLPFSKTVFLIISCVFLGLALAIGFVVSHFETQVNYNMTENRRINKWWWWRVRAFCACIIALGLSFLLPSLIPVIVVNLSRVAALLIVVVAIIIQLFQLIFRRVQRKMKESSEEIKLFIESGEFEEYKKLLEEILSYNL